MFLDKNLVVGMGSVNWKEFLTQRWEISTRGKNLLATKTIQIMTTPLVWLLFTLPPTPKKLIKVPYHLEQTCSFNLVIWLTKFLINL